MKTTQLRIYQLVPELCTRYLEWWIERLVPMRVAKGFTVEFAYLDRANNKFVWAVSLPVDKDEFERIDRAYFDSPERAEVFKDQPKWATSTDTSIVEVLS